MILIGTRVLDGVGSNQSARGPHAMTVICTSRMAAGMETKRIAGRCWLCCTFLLPFDQVKRTATLETREAQVRRLCRAPSQCLTSGRSE